MKKNYLLSSQNFSYGIAIILTIISLLPLFPTPQPATVSGNPWKLEFLFALITLAIYSLLILYRHKLTPLSNTIHKNGNSQLLIVGFIPFIVWSGISYFWASSPRSVIHHTFIWCFYFLSLSVFLSVLKNKDNFRSAIRGLLALTWIISFLCIFGYTQVLSSPDTQSSFRLTYSKYSELLTTLVPLFFAITLYVKPKSTFFYGLTSVVVWTAVVVSLSRASFIAASAGVIFLIILTLLFLRDRLIIKRGLILTSLFIIIAIASQMNFVSSSEHLTLYGRASSSSQYQQTSSNIRLLLLNVSAEMFKANPLAGVGADNFGPEINKYRAEFAKKNPTNKSLAADESMNLERAHNEYLQILTELGIIGLLLFGLFIVSFSYLIFKSIKTERKNINLMIKLGGCAGLVAFLISSLVSSFSFRAIQNGFVFFIILAIVCLTNAQTKNDINVKKLTFSPLRWNRLAYSVSLIIIILGLISFSTQGISNYFVILAENEQHNETALNHLENAGFYNGENASADLAFGFREFQYKRYSEAIPYLQKAIDKGLGVTIIYYHLARSQELSDNTKAAEKTLAEALRIFPHSIYARTHYAVLLKENGKDVEAEKQFDLARQISPKDARSWRIMFEESILQTTLEAQKNDNLIKPHDLSPHNIVYAMFIAEKMNEADNKPRVSKK